MTGRTSYHSHGFTLWELLVVIALVIILFVTALENLLPLRGDAERTAHAYTVNALRSAIGLQATQRALQRRPDSLGEMRNGNPMQWLAIKPERYVGNISAGEYETVPHGGWAFDAGNRVLFYRFRYPEYVNGDFMAPPGVRYRLDVSEGADGNVRKIELRQLDWFEWRTDGSEIRRLLERGSP